MGRRDRERQERIRKGLENTFVRAVAVRRARRELGQGDTPEQIGRLDELVGKDMLPIPNLRKALMDSAPREMDKAIRAFRKDGKEITVDSLCAEAKSSPQFLALCRKAGLDLAWFEQLARDRMEAMGV